MLPQLKSGFRRTISWNKYLLKPELLVQNPNLNDLVEPSFQGIRDGAYVTILVEHLYIQNNDVNYFDSFRVEHIPEEIKTFIGYKNIETKIFRIQAYNSIMCGYFHIGFIDFILVRKTFTDFTNLFSPNKFKESNDIILNYFMTNI